MQNAQTLIFFIVHICMCLYHYKKGFFGFLLKTQSFCSKTVKKRLGFIFSISHTLFMGKWKTSRFTTYWMLRQATSSKLWEIRAHILPERLALYVQVFNQNSWKENVSNFFPLQLKTSTVLRPCAWVILRIPPAKQLQMASFSSCFLKKRTLSPYCTRRHLKSDFKNYFACFFQWTQRKVSLFFSCIDHLDH